MSEEAKKSNAQAETYADLREAIPTLKAKIATAISGLKAQFDRSLLDQVERELKDGYQQLQNIEDDFKRKEEAAIAAEQKREKELAKKRWLEDYPEADPSFLDEPEYEPILRKRAQTKVQFQNITPEAQSLEEAPQAIAPQQPEVQGLDDDGAEQKADGVVIEEQDGEEATPDLNTIFRGIEARFKQFETNKLTADGTALAGSGAMLMLSKLTDQQVAELWLARLRCTDPQSLLVGFQKKEEWMCKLQQDVVSVAEKKNWPGIADKMRAWIIDSSKPLHLLLPAEKQIWIACALSIQNPDNLYPDQAFTLGHLLVAQNDAVLKLKGLAFLKSAARSHGWYGEQARFHLRRILLPMDWAADADEVPARPPANNTPYQAAAQASEAKKEKEPFVLIPLIPQAEIQTFLEKIEDPFQKHRTHLKQREQLAQCMTRLALLQSQVEKFISEVGSPQYQLWSTELAYEADLIWEVSEAGEAYVSLALDKNTVIIIQAALLLLKKKYEAVQEAHENIFVDEAAFKDSLKNLNEEQQEKAKQRQAASQEAALQDYSHSITAMQQQAAQLRTHLAHVLTLSQTQAGLWKEGVLDLKRAFESDITQISEEVGRLDSTLNEMSQKNQQTKEAKEAEESKDVGIVFEDGGSAQGAHSTKNVLPVRSTAELDWLRLLDALYHTHDDELVKKGIQKIDRSSLYAQRVAAHLALAGRYDLLKWLVENFPKDRGWIFKGTAPTSRGVEKDSAPNEMTALDIAAYDGNAEMAVYLLEQGAPIGNALFWALERKQVHVLEALLLHKFCFGGEWVCPKTGKTCLGYAIEVGIPTAITKFFGGNLMLSRAAGGGLSFLDIAPHQITPIQNPDETAATIEDLLGVCRGSPEAIERAIARGLHVDLSLIFSFIWQNSNLPLVEAAHFSSSNMDDVLSALTSYWRTHLRASSRWETTLLKIESIRNHLKFSGFQLPGLEAELMKILQEWADALASTAKRNPSARASNRAMEKDPSIEPVRVLNELSTPDVTLKCFHSVKIDQFIQMQGETRAAKAGDQIYLHHLDVYLEILIFHKPITIKSIGSSLWAWSPDEITKIWQQLGQANLSAEKLPRTYALLAHLAERYIQSFQSQTVGAEEEKHPRAFSADTPVVPAQPALSEFAKESEQGKAPRIGIEQIKAAIFFSRGMSSFATDFSWFYASWDPHFVSILERASGLYPGCSEEIKAELVRAGILIQYLPGVRAALEKIRSAEGVEKPAQPDVSSADGGSVAAPQAVVPKESKEQSDDGAPQETAPTKTAAQVNDGCSPPALEPQAAAKPQMMVNRAEDLEAPQAAASQEEKNQGDDGLEDWEVVAASASAGSSTSHSFSEMRQQVRASWANFWSNRKSKAQGQEMSQVVDARSEVHSGGADGRGAPAPARLPSPEFL